MDYPTDNNNQRGQLRVNVDLPATISIGSQITLKGQVKDLSLNSAFIKIKSSSYLNIHDEIGMTIQSSPDDTSVLVQGLAHISRVVPGEGFAIYFTKIDDDSLKRIKKLIQKSCSSEPTISK